jgi:hypothetical protein
VDASYVVSAVRRTVDASYVVSAVRRTVDASYVVSAFRRTVELSLATTTSASQTAAHNANTVLVIQVPRAVGNVAATSIGC